MTVLFEGTRERQSIRSLAVLEFFYHCTPLSNCPLYFVTHHGSACRPRFEEVRLRLVGMREALGGCTPPIAIVFTPTRPNEPKVSKMRQSLEVRRACAHVFTCACVCHQCHWSECGVCVGELSLCMAYIGASLGACNHRPTLALESFSYSLNATFIHKVFSSSSLAVFEFPPPLCPPLTPLWLSLFVCRGRRYALQE